MQLRKSTLIIIVALAALSRLIPHPPNFTPVIAMGLFGGAFFSVKRWAFLVPVFALFITDLYFGLHGTMAWVYGSMLLIVYLGMQMKSKTSPLQVAGMSLVGSLLFFLVTNFGVWITGGGFHHPLTLPGLMMTYVDGIPFLGNTLAGTAIYSAVLFGGFALLARQVPALQVSTVEK